MNITDFINEINSTSRKAFYLINGEDTVAKNKCQKALEKLVDPNFFDFNFKNIDLTINTWAETLSEALTMPFFIAPRVIIAKINSPINSQDAELILNYLENPNQSSCLVVFTAKTDGRQKLFKTIKKLKLEVEASPPQGVNLERRIKDEFEKYNIKTQTEAIKTLIDRLGGDVNFIQNEIEKLSLYLNKEETLTKDIVTQLVALSPNANIFELGESLAQKDVNQALKILTELLTTEHHLPVLAMIIRHFRILVQIKAKMDLIKTNYLGPQYAKEMNLHPFVLQKTQGQAKKWPWPRLTSALKLIEKANKDLMLVSIEPKIIMENLALNLTAL